MVPACPPPGWWFTASGFGDGIPHFESINRNNKVTSGGRRSRPRPAGKMVFRFRGRSSVTFRFRGQSSASGYGDGACLCAALKQAGAELLPLHLHRGTTHIRNASPAHKKYPPLSLAHKNPPPLPLHRYRGTSLTRNTPPVAYAHTLTHNRALAAAYRGTSLIRTPPP